MDALFIGAYSLGGLAALYFGAGWLVGASTDMARRLGVSPLLIGLTVVAVGTSLPELFVGVSAAIGGHPGVALGNVIGADALNLGLILGVAALIRPIEVSLRVLKRDLPVMFAATGLLAWFASDGRIGRLVALGRRERRQSLPGVSDLPHAATLLGVLALAAALGLSDGVIGMTLVAAGTTLPELVTTLVAAYRRQRGFVVNRWEGALLVSGYAAFLYFSLRPV